MISGPPYARIRAQTTPCFGGQARELSGFWGRAGVDAQLGLEVEVEKSAQDAWVETLLKAPPRMIGAPDCTPGYYNNEGQPPTPAMRLAVGYPAGPSAYFRYLARWRDSKDFAGLAFR